jgi:tetratricopeptide (TPR) repeat protein
MRQAIFILSVLLCFIRPSFATPSQKDSLEKVLIGQKDTVRIKTLLLLAQADPEQDSAVVMKYIREARDLSKEKNFAKGLAEADNQAGRQYYLRGAYGQALEHYKSAIISYEKIHDLKGLASVYTNIGVTYKDEGNLSVAAGYYLKAMELCEKIGDKKNLASNLNNMGVIYRSQKNYVKAIECYRRSRQLKLELGNRKGTFSNLSNIGSAYELMKNSDSALYYYDEALKIAEEFKMRLGIETISGNIGLVYSGQGRNTEAMSYFNKALKLATELDDKEGIAYCHLYIATAYRGMKNYSMAIDHLFRSLDVAIQIGSLDRQKEAYEGLAESYGLMNDHKNAYKYHQLYSITKDSLLSVESSKQITEMQTRYETEKKEKQIELLNKDKSLHEVAMQKKEVEIRQKNMQRNMLVAGLILVLALAVVSISAFRQKQKANAILEAQKQEIAVQKNIVEEQHKEIKDSIRYAQKIQEAMLPFKERIQKHLDEFFILYKPKDIVSGDFYWFYETNGLKIISVIDCTGHGVPGAFMSMIGNELLNDIVGKRGITDPGTILHELHKGIRFALKQEETGGQDGMDLVICTINNDKSIVQFAGAMNPLYVVQHGELKIIKGDKSLIGGVEKDQSGSFTTHTIPVVHPTMIYLTTDGYADQFGGPAGKKFKYKQMEELMLKIHDLDMAEQQRVLDETIESWKGALDQVDDITMVGIRV